MEEKSSFGRLYTVREERGREGEREKGGRREGGRREGEREGSRMASYYVNFTHFSLASARESA